MDVTFFLFFPWAVLFLFLMLSVFFEFDAIETSLLLQRLITIAQTAEIIQHGSATAIARGKRNPHPSLLLIFLEIYEII